MVKHGMVQKTSVALHEAGHSVMNLVCGYGLQEVALFAVAGEYEGLTKRKEASPDRNVAYVYMAGRASEELSGLHYGNLFDYVGSSEDLASLALLYDELSEGRAMLDSYTPSHGFKQFAEDLVEASKSILSQEPLDLLRKNIASMVARDGCLGARSLELLNRKYPLSQSSLESYLEAD